jgi:hypothetical protein
MHCDTSATWPTAAAQALLAAFPDLAGEVNKNGLTAQQTFDQGIDAEEPAAAKEEDAKASASSSQKTKRDQSGAANEEFLETAAAARAGTSFYLNDLCMFALLEVQAHTEKTIFWIFGIAAIARTKKKANKQAQAGSGGLSPAVWIAILLALLAVIYSVLFSS